MSTIRITTDIHVTVEQGAAWFCMLDGHQQANFFEHVMRTAEKWGRPPDIQWYDVARILAEAEREHNGHGGARMIRSLAEFIKEGK